MAILLRKSAGVALIFDFLPPNKFAFLSDKRERSFLEKLLCAKNARDPAWMPC
jgi:hypothetical protein